MNQGTDAVTSVRDGIRVDLRNLIETAGKNRSAAKEVAGRLFGPPDPPIEVAKKVSENQAPSFGLFSIVDEGLQDLRKIQNDTEEILARIMGKL